MTRVLVAEDIGASGVELLREHFDVDTAFDSGDFDLEGRIGDYDGLLIRSATKVTGELIEKAGNLRRHRHVGCNVADAPSRTQ